MSICYQLNKKKNGFLCLIDKIKKLTEKPASFYRYYARVTLPDFKVLVETHTRFGLPSTRIRTF